MNRVADDFVAAFNVGVETGDYRPMLRTLSPEVTVQFHGSQEPPFEGHDGAASAWRLHRPDDEIGVLDWHSEGSDEVISFSWLCAPDVAAGEMRLTIEDGQITRILIG